MILHTINKSPFEKATLERCIKHCKPGCAVLLIEDGVYCGLQNTKFSHLITDALKDIRFYVLEPDLNARGVQEKLIDGISKVSYEGFVDLTVEHDTVSAWL